MPLTLTPTYNPITQVACLMEQYNDLYLPISPYVSLYLPGRLPDGAVQRRRGGRRCTTRPTRRLPGYRVRARARASYG